MKKAGIRNPADFKITLPDDNSSTSVWNNLRLLDEAMESGAVRNIDEIACQNTNGEEDSTEADTDQKRTKYCLDTKGQIFYNIARVRKHGKNILENNLDF